jgi:hypothetical protein
MAGHLVCWDASAVENGGSWVEDVVVLCRDGVNDEVLRRSGGRGVSLLKGARGGAEGYYQGTLVRPRIVGDRDIREKTLGRRR